MRFERVTAITDLHSFIKRPYGKLSGGEKRRTDIATGTHTYTFHFNIR